MKSFDDIISLKKGEKVRIVEEQREEGTHVVLMWNKNKYYWIQDPNELKEFLEDNRDVVLHDGFFYTSVPKQ